MAFFGRALPSEGSGHGLASRWRDELCRTDSLARSEHLSNPCTTATPPLTISRTLTPFRFDLPTSFLSSPLPSEGRGLADRAGQSPTNGLRLKVTVLQPALDISQGRSLGLALAA